MPRGSKPSVDAHTAVDRGGVGASGRPVAPHGLQRPPAAPALRLWGLCGGGGEVHSVQGVKATKADRIRNQAFAIWGCGEREEKMSSGFVAWTGGADKFVQA